VIATYSVNQPNPESKPALIPFLTYITHRGDVNSSQSIDIADALLCATYDIDPENENLGARIGNMLSLVSKPVAHQTFPLSSAISPDIIITPEGKIVQAKVLLNSIRPGKTIGAARITVRWDCSQYIYQGLGEDDNTVTVLNDTDASRGVLVMAGIVVHGCREMKFPHIILEPLSEKSTGMITVDITEAVEAVTCIPYSGEMSYSRQVSPVFDQPVSLALLQNMPNPFNPATIIPYSIPGTMRISLVIYSAHGQKIKTLAEGEVPPGNYLAVWNGRDNSGVPVASGIYFYTLATDRSRLTKRLILLR
jgi:hypothetical protein